MRWLEGGGGTYSESFPVFLKEQSSGIQLQIEISFRMQARKIVVENYVPIIFYWKL